VNLLRKPRRTSDIELPNESGRVDARLPKSWATEKVQLRGVGRQLKSGLQTLNRTGLRAPTPSRSVSKR
jgi:hypothetical protein